MRIVQDRPIATRGMFPQTEAYSHARNDVHAAIHAIRWPPDADRFTIYPEPGKRRGKGNGVRPLKSGFVEKLVSLGWHTEKKYPRTDETTRLYDPGAFDAWLDLGADEAFVVEWETGNISSSHRALNKMALALLEGFIRGGYLVLPSRKLYTFLTDRVGNFREIEPYFGLWGALPIQNGYLGAIEIEHDAEDWSVPRIEKGTDGRALI